MRSESLKRAQRAYKRKLRRFDLFLRIDSEADVIAFLKSKGNVSAYLKKLIREDMEGR